jgi:succinoglycan biosynthesis protein ExoM
MAGGSSDESRVLVAMLTYRRPECLVRALPVLVEQAGTLARPAEILVVDNDPAGGAATEVARWADQGVHYAHEPKPGISAARNKALDLASGYDAIVFLDDDDLPTPRWLRRLVDAWGEWGCDGVGGPLRPELPAPDRWIEASGVFRRTVRPSGSRIERAATNNLLLSTAALRRYGLRFDERLGLIGGEDALLTHQLTSRGGDLRWCDEAEIVSPVPASRMNRGWVVRRIFRAGGSWSQMELAVASGRRQRARVVASLVVRAFGNIALGSARALLATARGQFEPRVRASCTVISYAGLLLGLLGYVHPEYRRPEPAGSTPAAA